MSERHNHQESTAYPANRTQGYTLGADSYNYAEQRQLETSKVLRNTYMLLALTLSVSAIACFIGMTINIRIPFLVFIGGAYGLMFLTIKLRNSVWGLASIFAFTGFMGLTLAPFINYLLHTANGGSTIMSALGLTAFAFFGLSAFVLVTRKDMSFLSNFIIVGFFVLLGASVLLYFLNIPALNLAISVGFILFSSAVILYQTSDIIHGGETNYIMATISLYVSIYNIFVSLLNILSASRN